MRISTYHKRACNLRALCKLLILSGLSGLSETQSWRKSHFLRRQGKTHCNLGSSCGGHRNSSFESTLCLLSNLVVSAFPHGLVLAGADAASMFPPYTSYGRLFKHTSSTSSRIFLHLSGSPVQFLGYLALSITFCPHLFFSDCLVGLQGRVCTKLVFRHRTSHLFYGKQYTSKIFFLKS